MQQRPHAKAKAKRVPKRPNTLPPNEQPEEEEDDSRSGSVQSVC